MALSEFELINRYFRRPGLAADPEVHPCVVLGPGDDCALLELPAGQQLALSLDVLVAGVHFPEDADPHLLAGRALAVNLSDLAAMGATPLGFTLGLTLPSIDERWLQGFSDGLLDMASRYCCPLLGGDTTRGPLQIAIQVHGSVAVRTALRRDGAKAGDDIYVSGQLGRAGLALAVLDNTLPAASAAQNDELLAAYYRPQPRLALGAALCAVATSAQDVSDGVLADLGHIARASRVAMQVQASQVPVAPVVSALCPPANALLLALTAGDDYELVFTAPCGRRAEVKLAAEVNGVLVTRIGRVLAGSGVSVCNADGSLLQLPRQGYDHFGDLQ